ncbi:MAG: hypothetical protein M1820_008640 [Bogoriella megaspora]|nr:MAG: hypothetical protein M1820_008640 [Bogoriella megaspora]
MDIGWLIGRSKVEFHHKATTSFKTNSGKTISLSDLCKSITPPCYLNPLLFNGHLQTFWTAVKSQDIPIHYRRKIFEAEDPAFKGTFAVDFVSQIASSETDTSLPPRTTYFSDADFENIGSDDDRPMLVTLHGLSGGSYEIYLRHVLAPLVGSGENGGWEACVVNSRGCAMSEITSNVLYNARATWDIRQTVKWLRRKFPNRKLFGIGYSLGANILTNYLGEEGDQCLLAAAVVVSNPWDLEISSKALQRTWLGMNVYMKVMGTNMKALAERHVDHLARNTRIDMDRVRKCKYLYEFDREVQGPTWGYPTENAYYRDAQSSDAVLAVKIPLFGIHARDDPIAVDEAIPYNEIKVNPNVVLCTTNLGGHLSWFQTNGERWFAKPAVNFLNKMAREVDPTSGSKNEPDGWAEGFKRGLAPPFTYMPTRRKLHIIE